MGDAIELNLSPSCYNCLSWSSDGELAVAAGDSIHLQLPQWKPKYVHPLFEKEKSMPWTSAKVRANVFTNKEWKTEWPSDRDSFSIGAEQSLSTVAALAWSHQGLGLHRRCVLAVLTSNLVLSLYEADGQRRTWSRAAIVNKALEKYFRAKVERSRDSPGEFLRKTRIRSFTWCPPLKNIQHDRADVRWGEHILTVATDDNDVVLIRVRRNNSSSGPTTSQYSMDVIARFTLNNAARNYSMLPKGSLWAGALESKSRILHIACGPWSRMAEENSGGESRVTFGALIALALGSNLHFIHAQASLISGDDLTVSIEGQLSYYPNIPHSEPKTLEDINFTGPLSWIPIDASRLSLTVGSLGGRVTLRFENNAYDKLLTRTDHERANIAFHQRSFEESKGYKSIGAMYSQHNEPITGIVAPQSLVNANDNRSMYLTTLGLFLEAVPLSTIGTPLEETLSRVYAPWTTHMERYRQKYDIQYELGDMAIVRTWGLSTFDGWTAVAFTMHPGDVLEYTTRAEENTIIIFTHPDPNAVFPKPAEISDELTATKRAEILQYILSSANKLRWCDLRSARLVYAACVYAINLHYHYHAKQHDLLRLARQALSHLSAVFNLPITEELSYCDSEQDTTASSNNPLGATPKPASLLEGPGGWIFEKCQTCFRRKNENVGLSWQNPNTAICGNGHAWNRCALTFLAIQQPYTSMFCSICDTSVLSRDKGVNYTLEGINLSTNSQQQQHEQQQHNDGSETDNAVAEFDPKRRELYDLLYDRYDTCAYCGGKYQDE
ncbi:hypothetical protein UA08_01195 [Talaromyces atroroseus]|uniref:Transcription factor IIIC putative zinc-finger domain-containing protein n=1 Tax=Talaromyces atroroseus TaxID=1441469 RepID=A0A1Q5QAD4_TALAT|nr:hypothetical protein UA08_01195 [Talaromyces atroroseus]OKL62907.1 hypothetical protein UA08_01195 [Talaromyces atroroseus]